MNFICKWPTAFGITFKKSQANMSLLQPLTILFSFYQHVSDCFIINQLPSTLFLRLLKLL